MPELSVLIVNYNGEDQIRDCLKSLAGQSCADFEIVIVDNGSKDQSLSEIKKALKLSWLCNITKIIELSSNSGFAGGNARGLKETSGRYIATLNNDTEVNETWLEELLLAIKKDERIGICASRLIAYGTKKIDSAGDLFSRALRGFKRGEREPAASFGEGCLIFGACAGAALYRREMLEDIGFFDEDFFLIYEDTDLNLRAQLAGWKVMYVPTAIVYHKVRSSIGKMSELAAYYSLRNSELVRFKNIPFGVFLLCLPQFIIGMISEFVYFAIKHRFFRLYLKAKFDALKLLPKMLRKRKEILKKRKVSNKYILEIMTPLLEKNFIKSKIRKLLHD